jgi:hypothetical protein
MGHDYHARKGDSIIPSPGSPASPGVGLGKEHKPRQAV